EVAGDGREVERGAREDEPFERARLEEVPHAGRALRLLAGDEAGEVDVEAEEVDELARPVDLRLVRRLALAEPGRRVERGAEAGRQQLGRLEEEGGPRGPGEGGPVRVSAPGRRDGEVRVLLGALVGAREEEVAAVRRSDVLEVAGGDLLAADEHGDLD